MMTLNSVPQTPKHTPWQLLAEFTLPLSQQLVGDMTLQLSIAVDELHLPITDWGRLQAAVAGAATAIKEKYLVLPNQMNLTIRVQSCARETENTGLPSTPVSSDASRGWGFFLVERIEADQQTTPVDAKQIIEVFIYPE